MAIWVRIFMMVSMAICLTSVAHAAEGNAVYYKPNSNGYIPSACYQNQNHGNMVAGVRDELWDNGAACGRKYTVRCTGAANTAPHPCHDGASVTVTVVDYCKPKCNGILNLSQDAFAVIADLDAGNVKVEYNPA